MSNRNCDNPPTGKIPLLDLKLGLYQGYNGGLYTSGTTARPADHETLGLYFANQIRAVNRCGKPNEQKGNILLISIGMSSCHMEFSRFNFLYGDDSIWNPQLRFFNTALGGQTVEDMIPRDAPYWQTVIQALEVTGYSRFQPQVVWFKNALDDPNQFTLDQGYSTSAFPNHALAVRDAYIPIMQNIKFWFPNVKICYVTSKNYGGYVSGASENSRGEITSYEKGFGMKWFVDFQVNGDMRLNCDPREGKVAAPWIAWGPYIWADGINMRSDGLDWDCVDFQEDDGYHPATPGRTKVATLLYNFLTTDTTAIPWALP